MLEQRYYDVLAYQLEIRDESARQRLAQLGRTRRTAPSDRFAALHHAVDRLRSGGFGGSLRRHPPTAHPAH